jgi:DNA-binding IclR family transcriptional regulator
MSSKRENMPLRVLRLFLREPAIRRPAAEILLLTGFTKPAVYRALAELSRYDFLLKQNRNYFINPEIAGKLQSQKNQMKKNLTTQGKNDE